jgi:multidrug efflux system outer membrane protein
MAELELAESERQLGLAAGLVSGQLSGGYGVTVGERTAPDLEEPQSLDSTDFDPIRLDLAFNVVPFGPSHDSVLAAEAQVLQAELALRDARSAAGIDAVEQLLTALRAAEEVEVRRFAASVARAELEATTLRFEGGTAPSTQLTQAQLALMLAENDVSAAELAASQGLRTLSAMLGVQMSEVAPFDRRIAVPEPPLGEELLMQRSDVQRALLSVAQVERSAASTLRSNLPTGSLGLAYNTAGDGWSLGLGASFDTRNYQPALSGSFDPDSGSGGGVPGATSSSVSLSVGLTVPLDSGVIDALALSELARERALLAFEQTLTSARLELLLSADRVASFEASAALVDEQLAQTDAALAIAEERFALGLVSRLDVLAAERSVREQQLRSDRAADSLLLAQLSYLRASALDPLEVF